ncbi:hypothetical protein DSECCO2_131760 [anaerobic digester metagenome]
MGSKSLTQCLEVFNRKERYWLIRNCCGNGDDLALPLGSNFRSKLKDIDGLEDIDFENAWWAMDYHIDWLIAALTLFQDQDANKIRNQNEKYKISGTQEDFDFIICVENKLIFIEAKLSTGWDREQLDSKIERLKDMEALFQNTEQYFILFSPEFQNIKSTISYVTNEWTSMRTGYICLETPPQMIDGSRFLKVIRCDENSTADKDGAYWKASPCSR